VSERLRIHEGEHQDLAALHILGDARNQTVGTEFGLQRGAEFNFRRGGTGREHEVAHE
jgi:hypothetical protein